MNGPRYSIIPADALTDPRVKDGHLRVLSILGTFTDRNGWCEVNQKSIAERAGKSRETVNRIIGDLCEFEYLQKEARWSKDRSRLISRYQVRMDRSIQDESMTSEDHTPCDAGITPPVTSEDHTPCDAQTSQLNDPSFNDQESLSETTVPDAPAKARKRKSYPDLFEASWKAYPTDPLMSKKEAFDAWQRLDDEDRVKLDDSLPAFTAYCASHPDYRPIHFCRYVTKRRFDGFAPASAGSDAPLPDEAWRKRLRFGRHEHRWFASEWGPPPGEPDCIVPPHLIEPGDGEGWREAERTAA